MDAPRSRLGCVHATQRTWTRHVTLLVLSSLFVVFGCREPADPGARLTTTPTAPLAPTTPTAPTEPTEPAAPKMTPTPPATTSDWKADATVVSVAAGSTPACGWGTSPGDVRSDVGWAVTVTTDAITLDEDMRNYPTDDIPYTGRLDGAQFTAHYTSGSNYADFTCQFREATLTGRFTSDSTFEAAETLIWGRPGTETTVTRSWKGSRL